MIRVILFAIVFFGSFASVPAAAAVGGAQLAKPFSKCRLTDPMQLSSIEAECAEISIPESDKPGGRRITLSVARVPAINQRKQSDPIVLLAGGPGQGAQLAFTTTFFAFARAGRQRDILLLDQRGTGRSNPLTCDVEAGADRSGSMSDAAAFLRVGEQCLERLSAKYDLGAYTTSRAVADLEAVRSLLGYETLNLYAGSYGTRVAQHYARRYPTRVRSMVLDGVVAPQTVLGPRMATDAQHALDGIWKRCADDAVCRKAFGDMAAKTRDLRARLQKSAQSVQVAHPRTAVLTSIDFGAEQLSVVLRFGSYDPHFAAMLPLVVSEAARGDYRPIATLFLLTSESVQEVLAMGMHNSVVCSEDVPRFDSVAVDRAALSATYIGTGFVDALPMLCKNWPRGRVDADFFKPLVSTVPTLLLSGTLDPVTPPADAERVARGLRNSRHLTLQGAGHGQLAIPCMDRVLADFFATTDAKALDASCLDRRMQPPFWVSLAGPAP